ncbi:Molybdenum ABC transporter, periplasmic molybdenum-binding protein ModA [Actinokineospora spheciospongiae]|uniref:Molybdenum ABC transporter, periplasmic molybdenum-binding protein ModA n=1 Tax=Actinokineospora spheciospongiae TaxID=909613 RepID=W7ID26_9PSEU|nr:molybdate ABC transporter substrate-binding protein [Actinokineospora spheciospongiae]EWC58735.1 Molybdenum ABC transporter, periplasmic molybdenum-binding protein ModA [Actinokineospora spheciospongiae]
MRKFVVVAAAALVLAGCGTGSDQGGRALTVFAAASLTESFTALEKEFEAGHPGVDVRLNFAGSSALAQQLANDAAADVFASADTANMEKVEALLAAPAVVFATNKLTIVTPPGNPAKITGLADLGKEGVTTVVCAPQVPCGAASKKAADAAGVTLRPASEEQDVKAVLTKVRAGEADAGLVYVSDAKAAGDGVTAVGFPEADKAVNDYPIAVLKSAPQADLAGEFVALVRGADGQAELARAGFSAP